MAEDVKGVPTVKKIMGEETSSLSQEMGIGNGEDGEELFEVEKIVGMSKNRGNFVYKVRWRGYPPSHDTWEPVDNLESCLDMVEDFENKREESRQKRALERKKKQAIMEGRTQEDLKYVLSANISTNSRSSFITEEHPETTLKDTFWKDLEEGKVNLFATDMYSKVKGQGRASRPTSFKQIFNSSKSISPTPDNRMPSVRRKSDSSSASSSSKKKSRSTPSKKTRRNKILKEKKTSKASRSLSYKSLSVSDCVSNDSNDSALTRSSINSDDISVTTPQSISSENPSSEFDSGVFDSSLSKTFDSPEDGKDNFSEIRPISPDLVESGPRRKSLLRNSPKSSTDTNTKSASRERSDSEEHVALKRSKLDTIPFKQSSPHFPPAFDIMNNFDGGKENMDETRQNIVTHLSDFSNSRSKSQNLEGLICQEKNRGKNVQDFTQPLENLLSESFLNLSPNIVKGSQDKGCDIGFDIDLNDVDLDDLDRQMSFSPSSNPAELTDDEFKKAVLEGDYELVKRAFSSMKLYDLDERDEEGNSLLMLAVSKGFDDVCELLVYHGANINAKNKNGFTPLMLASEKCDVCTVALLIEIGANLNIQQSNGETSLIKAVKRGHKQITQCLLDAGANFALKSNSGYSALTYAKTMRNLDIEDLMIDHISRLTSEFDKQVALTLNNTARIITALFPMQCFPLKEGNKFVINFKHVMEPLHPGVGFLLFISHARIKQNDIRCRLHGPCAVTSVILNGVRQPTLTENLNFVLSCHPLLPGKNELCINTESAPTSKAKLVVCAYKAQLMAK